MAKKEKKVKQKKLPKQKKQAPLVPEHQRPLICPPDQAGRGLGLRILGYVCRCIVVMCLVWALMMFFSGGIAYGEMLSVGVSEFKMLLLAAVATAALGLVCYNRLTALGGVALGAVGIAVFAPNAIGGVLALYNGFLCRLYISKFTLYLTNLGIGVPGLTSAADLAAYYNDLLSQCGQDGLFVLALVLSAVFVPFVAKRTRPVLPTIACLVIIVPICVFNVATSGLGAGMLMASIAAVLVMWAYDKMFRRKVDTAKYDTKMQLFKEEGKPEYPEEYLQKQREKAEKKQQKKLARAEKKQKRKKDKTTDEEISDYFKTPKKKVKAKKPRLTEQEKKALKQQKREQRLHQKEVRKQVRAVRRYEKISDSAKSAMGGFAAAMMLVVCLIVVIVPSLLIDSRMVIELLDEKISHVRAYVTATLMGDDERLDELEYELDGDNFKPHSTKLEHVQFENIQLFRVESRYALNMYMRGWIGVDYRDGAWYTGQSTKDEENPGVFDVYRDLYKTSDFPSDRMFYDFYATMHPELEVFDENYDFLNKHHKYSDLGFVATTVHIRRINSYSSLLYLPSVYDPSRPLKGYGNAEISEHSFVNYFDGILTGRDFADRGTKYSAMTLAPIKTDKDWIGTLGTDIADYNLQKEMILLYNSYEKTAENSYTRPQTNYRVKIEENVPEKGLTTITYRKGFGNKPENLVAAFVHPSDRVSGSVEDKRIVILDAAGNEYVIELDSDGKVDYVGTAYADSLFARYVGGSQDFRDELESIMFGGDAEDAHEIMDYSEYAYTYYTGKSESEIIAELADYILHNATYKVKEQVGSEWIEAVTHEEYHPIGTQQEIDFENNTYYTMELVADENGEMVEQYTVCENADASMMSRLYEKIIVVDEEAYESPVYEITEYPYDFSGATVQNATWDTATVHRNDLVKAVIDYIIDDLGCKYTLTPELEGVDPSLDGVENFLSNTHEGYCVQFASAVCLILREYGIPARYVEGYIANGFKNGAGAEVATFYTVVMDYEAHAWVEVFFDGIGWVQYECTPAYYEGMYGGQSTDTSKPDNDSTERPPSIQDEIDDIISSQDPEEEEIDKEALAEEEQRRQATIAAVIVVSVALVVVGVIWVIWYLRSRASSAEYKRSSAIDTVLSEHFGQNTSEDERRELSYTMIDALHNLLDIYGLAPETGEFKDEYARRLARDLEDLLGRSPEYEPEQEEQDPNAPAPLPVSPHRMGQIMDAIAAEEFGHGMSVAQMKQVALLYKDLRALVHKRVPLGRRLTLRYFSNRL